MVHSALRTAVRTLALSEVDERRLLALLDEADRSVLDGRLVEGIVMLRRFTVLIDAVARAHRLPARLLERDTPYDRLARSRRRRAEPAPG